jgi:hypothetical protein
MKNIVIYDVKIGDKIKCPKTNEFKIVRDYDIWAKDKYINVWFEDNTMTRLSYGGFHPTWIEIEEKEIEENKYICNSCHEHYPANEMDFDAEDGSDLCKNCNHISHNDSPYGEIKNEHEITINAVELASELASSHLERVHTDRIVIWELSEVGESYTEEAQDIFNDLYDNYYSLIQSTKI